VRGRKNAAGFRQTRLVPVTADALPDVNPTVAAIEKSRLLGTTDPGQLNKMLDLAKQFYH
jgi:iron(III) transport system substrate-binding protein